MNVFYFVKRFPRTSQTAVDSKIFSLSETLVNLGHNVHFVSADLSDPKGYEELKSCPYKLIHINPKKINVSLSSSKVKPDLALFNSFEMEEMYSAYMYNKWNTCPKVLEVNEALRLQKHRRKNQLNADITLVPTSGPIYNTQDLFSEGQAKSIERSDFYIAPNDFLYFLLSKNVGAEDRIALISHGYPSQEYLNETKTKQYRPFGSRKNMAFMGSLEKDTTSEMIYTLSNRVWPLIRKTIPDVQLHVYGHGKNAKLFQKRKQLEEKGVLLRPYDEDCQFLQRYRLSLYPARFSCGLKGKVIDSWLYHTPVVTTPIGAEGMFFESLNERFSKNMNSGSSMFLNERVLTREEEEAQKSVRSYYSGNDFASRPAGLKFGGSFLNYSVRDFAKSCTDLYNDEQKWAEALKIGQRTILKNQDQVQMEINVKSMLSKMELAVFKTRNSKVYRDEWRRFIISKDYEKRIHTYE